MTPTVYLLLSICLFFFITTCIYAFYCNQREVELAYEDLSNENDIEQFNYIEQEEALSSGSKEVESIHFEKDIDIRLELKKCNQRLNRNLKTLSYISFMKANNSLDGAHLNDLDNLKQNVQYEVVRITKQINLYKTQIKDQVAA